MIKRGEKIVKEKQERLLAKEAGEDSEAEDLEMDMEDDNDLTEDEGDQYDEDGKLVPPTRKFRVLSIASRGVNSRQRHLITDLQQMLPHTRHEPKMDSRDPLSVIDEICDMRSCSHAIFFDSRKHTDLYMSFAKASTGPTLRFFVENVHTMAEMNLTGNHLRGSRALLSFDETFETAPMWRLAKEMLSQIFCVPRYHPKSKPFMDHVFMFSVQDGRIWFRNFQIIEQGERKAEERSLVEVGPRFVLNPVKFYAGCFGGQVIYSNDGFVSPIKAKKLEKIKEGDARKKEALDSVKKEQQTKELLESRLPSEMDVIFDNLESK